MDKIARLIRIFLITVLLFCGSLVYPQMVSQEQRRATNVQQLQMLESRLQQTYQLQKEAALQKAGRLNWPVRRVFPDGRILELQGLKPNGMPLYYITYNLNAAITTQTEQIWPSGSVGPGLTGAGLYIAEWDGGAVRFDHQEFGDRVEHQDINENDITVDTLSSHATHVAGTLIAGGTDPNAQGMAPEATLYVWDFNSDRSEASGAADTLLISNHSYGPATGWNYSSDAGIWTWFGYPSITLEEDVDFGLYVNSSQQWDQITYNAPYYLPVFAAGNDRNDVGPEPDSAYVIWDPNSSVWDTVTAADPDYNPPAADGNVNGNYDTMSGPGLAKNVLTVGAIDDIPGGAFTATEEQIMPFSAWGPADDGRVKPDIVANGFDLYSPDIFNNTSYDNKSGTSMAAPNAAGSMLLLQELYRREHPDTSMRASTLKGLVIQTADDLGNTGPDYSYGWGLLNARRAAEVILNEDNSTTILEDSLNSGDQLIIDISVPSPQDLKATLVWTDPAGSLPQRSLDPADNVLVNDLDMIINGLNEAHSPWIFEYDDINDNFSFISATTGDNVTDNVEQVFISASEIQAGETYRIALTHKGSLADGKQNFSLIVNAPQTNVPNRSPLLVNPLGDEMVEEEFEEFAVANLRDVFYDASEDLSFTVETDSKSNARISSDDSLFVSSVPDSFGTSLVVVTAADSQFSRKDTLTLDILPVNDPPEPFALILPADGFYNRTDIQVAFQWQGTEDIDNEELHYVLTFRMDRNGDTLFTTTGDTTLSIHVIDLDLPRETQIEWDVLATDREDSTFSSNGPFSFVLSDELEIVNYAGSMPEENTLLQNYPNPFKLNRNNFTSIAFGLTESQPVTITIFDLQGRVIKHLVNETRDAGWHKEEWDGRDNSEMLVGSGVYFYRIATPGFIDTKKLLLLK
ncbi:MAG: S8 family serine peptidase [Candidatus Marinimicrobia bacterium]|nr:S8 family serine peptidase [Candidatus Neomarinimicrobiota bacterium]